MTRLLLVALACTTLLPGCNNLMLRTDPQLRPFPGQIVDTFDQQHCPEPSGIVFSAARGTLFAVGDEGDICELQTDGTLLQQGRVRKTDLEGITVNPSTGRLYLLDEHSASIIEMDPDSLEVLRHISIDLLPTQHNPKKENRGFEAITFYPDPGQQLNSHFFIANQGNPGKRSAAVHKLTVPLQGSGDAAKVLQAFELPVTDLSGLHYDHSSGLLFIISDEHNTLMLITTDAVIRTRYALPGKNQEGITLDNMGNLYIAEDSGNIVKYALPAMLKHTTIPQP